METTLGVVFLLVVSVLRLQDIVLDTILVLRALSLSMRGLREIRVLVLSFYFICTCFLPYQ